MAEEKQELQALELQITGDSTKAIKSLNSLCDTLDRLKKATAGGCGLGAVSKEMEKMNGVSVKFSSSSSSVTKSLAKLGTKAMTAVYSMKRITNVIGSWVTESNNYVENLNLFTVSMGEYAASAQEYAESIGDVLGIDPSTWMRNQGVFMTLGKGFGVASDRAAVMSQQLTQLGYDVSSFFNISVEDAMQRLQSGISGELEPLRRLGYDLSQAKLEATALSLGIDKAVSSMTQAEKAELRYYAIMNQVTDSHGDMARTLEAPANQLRIFKAQVTQAGRALGNIFIPALNAVLPYAIAALKVIRLLANTIAGLVGFTLPEIDYSDLSDGVGDTSDALEEATDNAKKFKKMLLGIDELNVMSDNSSDSSEDLTGGGFSFELPTYDFIGDASNSKINEIVEKMKEWLGITGEIGSWAELMDTRFGNIVKSVGAIVGVIAGIKLITGIGILVEGVKKLAGALAAIKSSKFVVWITEFVAAVKAMAPEVGWFAALFPKLSAAIKSLSFKGILSGIGKVASKFGWVGAIIAGVIAGITYAIGHWNEIVKVFKSYVDDVIAPKIQEIKDLFNGIGDAVTSAIPESWIEWIKGAIAWLGEAIAWLWEKFGGSVFHTTMAGVMGILNGIITAIKGVVQFTTGVVQVVVGTIEALVKTIIAIFNGNWEAVLAPLNKIWTGIKNIFGGLYNIVVAPVIETVKGVIAWFTHLSNSENGLTIWFGNACSSIAQFFVNLWNGIVAIWTVVASWFNNNVITPVVGFFCGLWTSVSGFFASLWNDVVRIFTALAGWFNNNVIRPVVGFFSGLVTSVSGFFVNLWTNIVKIFTALAGWFNTNVITPVVKVFRELWNKISTAASTCWNAIVTYFSPAITWFSALFKSIWQTVSDIFYNIGVIVSGCWEIIKAAWAIASGWFNTNVIQPVSGFFTQLWNGIKEAAISAWGGIKTTFATIANWIDVNIIQPVSTFFSSLWNGMKEAAVSAWNGITSTVTSVWNGIKETLNNAKTWINTNIVQPISTFFSTLWNGVKTAAVSAWNGIKDGAVSAWNGVKNALSVAGNWVTTTVVTPVSKVFSGLWDGFKQGAVNAWEGIKSVFSKVGTFFSETFQKAWSGIVKVFSVAGEIFTNIKDAIVSAFKTVVNGLIKGLNKVIAVPFNGINAALEWLKDVSIFGLTPFSSLKTINIPEIPLLADGGVVGSGQMFVAREAGPELVGTIGNRSAVVNNDQIVDSVAKGVYQAVVQAMSQSGNNQVVEAKVNDKVLFEVVLNRNRQETMRKGFNPLMGGV